MSDDLAEKVAAVLGAVRSAHSIEVIQGGVGQCVECDEILRVEYGDDGRPLFNPFTRHHLEAQAAALLPLIREREAAAWDRALETVAAGVESAMEAHREHGHRESVSTLSGLLTAIPRTANPYAGSEGA